MKKPKKIQLKRKISTTSERFVRSTEIQKRFSLRKKRRVLKRVLFAPNFLYNHAWERDVVHKWFKFEKTKIHTVKKERITRLKTRKLCFLRRCHSQKKMRLLRRTLKSTLPYLFFQPWKKAKLIPTKKQQWLKIAYNTYNSLPPKDRIDFFQTTAGKLLMTTEMHSQIDSNRCWWGAKQLWKQSKKILGVSFSGVKPEFLVPVKEQYFQLMATHRKGWWYENLVRRKKPTLSEKNLSLIDQAQLFKAIENKKNVSPEKILFCLNVPFTQALVNDM